jgi:hypothetical protein
MRIISVRVSPVANILSVIYGAFGLIVFGRFAFSDEQSLTIPLGIVAPLVNFSLDLHMQRSPDTAWNLFLCAAAVIGYAINGWITAAIAVFCFNFVARRTGGIDAKFVSTIDDTHLQDPPG